MKDYPFNELDYFARKDEGGFSRLLAFLDQPSKEKFALIPEGIKNPEETDPGFWGAVEHWCFAGLQRPEVIYHVLNFCFEVAYHKIKEKWYGYMGEPVKKEDLSKQHTYSLGVCRNNVYGDPNWQEYREIYERSYSVFIQRIELSLNGYHIGQIEVNDRPEPFAVERPVGYILSCTVGQQRNLIERLRDLLMQRNLIDCSLNDLLPVFAGQPVQNEIVWRGTNGELKYFIDALVKRDCLNIKRNDWVRAERIFRHPDGLFIPKQLADNYTEPTDDRKEIIHQILATLHAHNVGRAPE
ncbi:hypothetical protein GCM10027299_55770 [Larkinella ripae]